MTGPKEQIDNVYPSSVGDFDNGFKVISTIRTHTLGRWTAG